MNHTKMNRTGLLVILLLFLTFGLTAQSFRRIETSIQDDLHALTFSGKNGWAISYGSGNLYKSPDNGETWQRIWTSDSLYYEEIQFTSKKSGYLVGEKGNLLLTNDGGKTWRDQLPSNLKDKALLIYGAYFSDTKNGFVNCQPTSGKGASYNLLLAGGKWKILADTLNAFLKINPFNKDYFIGCTAGEVVRFDKEMTDVKVLYKKSSNAIGALRDVGSVDGKFLYAIGSRGYFICSADGGATWKEIAVATTRIRSVLFTTNREGYIVGDQGLILETHDGGASWVKHDASWKEDLHRIIRHENTIWICGKGGLILTQQVSN